MKRALVILVVALFSLACITAKSSDDSLRFGFEAGYGKNWTNGELLSDATLLKIEDNGFYADAVLEYHMGKNWAVKIGAGVQYQRKAEVELGDDRYKNEEKTGMTVEAQALIRYTFYNYEGFSLFASFGAEGIMGKIGPVNDTYDKEMLTNMGAGVSGEIGTEIMVAYRTYFSLGVRASYIIYNSTKLVDKENGPVKTMSMYLLRPYVGFTTRIY